MKMTRHQVDRSRALRSWHDDTSYKVRLVRSWRSFSEMNLQVGCLDPRSVDALIATYLPVD